MFKKNKSASVCPQCGAPMAPESTSCQYCGARFQPSQPSQPEGKTKFCKFCGGVIPFDAVVCTKCGRQVEQLERSGASGSGVVINNTYNVRNRSAPLFYHRSYVPMKKPLSKWTAIFLCLFLGGVGAHKFYEGKVGMGILYLCTLGLAGIGIVIDLIVLLTRPNPYYV